jgi:hypothetical protein
MYAGDASTRCDTLLANDAGRRWKSGASCEPGCGLGRGDPIRGERLGGDEKTRDWAGVVSSMALSDGYATATSKTMP